jgi:chaperonin GroES
MIKFRPLFDHVLIARKASEDRYGSIIIPDNAKEDMLEGTIEAVGRGICNSETGEWRPLDVAVGDRVLFGGKHMGTETKIENSPYLIARQNDLAAVILPSGDLRPFFDRVLVERDEGAKMIGSLYLPENAIEKTTLGKVIALGSGRILPSGVQLAWSFAVGDRILFGKFAGTDVKVEGKDVLILREEDVMGVVVP